jgi:predicted RNA polymerase sigma factor
MSNQPILPRQPRKGAPRKPPSWWIRELARHVALAVRRRGTTLTLYERYGERTKIGTFRTWAALERAINQYMDDQLAKLGKR